MKKICSVSILGLLTACSTTIDNPDPHRTFNKNAMEFNNDVDDYVLRPLAVCYDTAVPDVVKGSFYNFFLNWKEPYHIVNYTLEFEGENASTSLFRFLINSTIGILGLFDVAEFIGLDGNPTNHQATLTKLDVPNGDYLVLPIFGASSTRDAIAEPISWFADPVGYFIGLPYMLLKAGLSAVDNRAAHMAVIDNAKKDPDSMYATMKSIYTQKYVSQCSKLAEDENYDEDE